MTAVMLRYHPTRRMKGYGPVIMDPEGFSHSLRETIEIQPQLPMAQIPGMEESILSTVGF